MTTLDQLEALLPDLPAGELRIEGSIYEGFAACLAREIGGERVTVAHVVTYADAKLLAAVNRLPALLACAKAAEKAGKVFRGYQQLHLAKKTHEADAKAAANGVLAEEMEAALKMLEAGG